MNPNSPSFSGARPDSEHQLATRRSRSRSKENSVCLASSESSGCSSEDEADRISVVRSPISEGRTSKVLKISIQSRQTAGLAEASVQTSEKRNSESPYRGGEAFEAHYEAKNSTYKPQNQAYEVSEARFAVPEAKSLSYNPQNETYEARWEDSEVKNSTSKFQSQAFEVRKETTEAKNQPRPQNQASEAPQAYWQDAEPRNSTYELQSKAFQAHEAKPEPMELESGRNEAKSNRKSPKKSPEPGHDSSRKSPKRMMGCFKRIESPEPFEEWLGPVVDQDQRPQVVQKPIGILKKSESIDREKSRSPAKTPIRFAEKAEVVELSPSQEEETIINVSLKRVEDQGKNGVAVINIGAKNPSLVQVIPGPFQAPLMAETTQGYSGRLENEGVTGYGRLNGPGSQESARDRFLKGTEPQGMTINFESEAFKGQRSQESLKNELLKDQRTQPNPIDSALKGQESHTTPRNQEERLKEKLSRQTLFQNQHQNPSKSDHVEILHLDGSDADTEPPESDLDDDDVPSKRDPVTVIPRRPEDMEASRDSQQEISHIELRNGVHLRSRLNGAQLKTTTLASPDGIQHQYRQSIENYYAQFHDDPPSQIDPTIRSFPLSPTRQFDIPLQMQTMRRPGEIIKPENPGEIIHHHPVFVKDVSKYWYKPTISREQAINMLRDKTPGTFVVRDSNSFPGAFGLALKVAAPPPGVQSGDGTELVRHFLIEPSPKGVKLKGCNNEPVFGSLSALVYQHSITPLALPAKLILPDFDPATSVEHVSAAQLLLEQGAACNVAYVGSVDCESLTGKACVELCMARLWKDNVMGYLTPVSVHFKVSAQGITLTDNTRKLFFRRHFPTNTVIYAGPGPDDQRWDNTDVIGFSEGCVRNAKVFAVVARKVNQHENQCHVFAELEPEQPAHAVLNFINKVLLNPSRRQ